MSLVPAPPGWRVIVASKGRWEIVPLIGWEHTTDRDGTEYYQPVWWTDLGPTGLAPYEPAWVLGPGEEATQQIVDAILAEFAEKEER